MRVFINVRSFSSGQPVSSFLFPPFSIEESSSSGCGSIVTGSQTSSDCHNQNSDLMPMSRLSLLSLTVVGTSVKSEQTLPGGGCFEHFRCPCHQEALRSPSSWRIPRFPPHVQLPVAGSAGFQDSLCPLPKGSLFSAGWFLTPTAPSSFPKTKNNARPKKSEPWGWCPGSKHFKSSQCFSCSQGENCPSIVHAELVHSCPSYRWKQDKFSARSGSFPWVLDFYPPTRHLSWGPLAAGQNQISCLLSQTCSFSCPSYFRKLEFRTLTKPETWQASLIFPFHHTCIQSVCLLRCHLLSPPSWSILPLGLAASTPSWPPLMSHPSLRHTESFVIFPCHLSTWQPHPSHHTLGSVLDYLNFLESSAPVSL